MTIKWSVCEVEEGMIGFDVMIAEKEEVLEQGVSIRMMCKYGNVCQVGKR
jgi:hypothetical protein